MKRMKKLICVSLFFALINLNQAQTVTDIDGNIYNTVDIGTQTWMKENLKVTHYNNGDAIPNVTSNSVWASLSTGAYCYFNNNSTYASTYGILYNYYSVVDSRKLCPTGWYVPSKAEWAELSEFLGGEEVAGGKLKEIGTTHWFSPNTGATDEVGFTALPGGLRHYDGSFGMLGEHGSWWTTTVSNNGEVWINDLFFENRKIWSYEFGKTFGFSVRCIKDITSNIEDFNKLNNIKIYPNPANDHITIDFNDVVPTKIEIFNIYGQSIYLNEKISLSEKIDISSLKSGIYIIEVSNSNLKYQQKFLIQ